MNSLTATVAMRPLAMRAGSTAPARSTCAMIQPPKMSPLALLSAGSGITRITSSAPSGKLAGPVSAGGHRGPGACFGGHRHHLHLDQSNHSFMRRCTAPRCPPRQPSVGPPPSRAPTGARWRAAALPVALPLARGHRAGLPGGGQGANVGVPLLLKTLVDAHALQARRRRGAAGGAGGPARRLRRAAAVDLAVHRTARAHLRQGHRGARRAASRCRSSATCTR
jgi:hypothetical protein